MNERVMIGLLTAGQRPEGSLDYDDDVCVIDGLVMSTDMLVEGVDFRRETFSAEDIGYKALAVALSDLAGSGATPVGYLQSIAFPKDIDGSWLQGYARGTALHKVPLFGGDLSGTPGVLTISMTVFGRTPRLLRRRAAHVGDVLLVTGPLGAAAAGLTAIEKGITDCQPALLQAQRRPTPRLELGAWLAERPEVHSAMDLSDGLAADLPRFVPAGMGAELGQIPGALGLEQLAAQLGVPMADWLLRGGEDFELLIAAEPDSVDSLISEAAKRDFALFRIGRVTADGRLPDLGTGFDHFAR